MSLRFIEVTEDFANHRGDLFSAPGLFSLGFMMSLPPAHFFASNSLARLSSGRVELDPWQSFSRSA
jgi:hypothetical protein